MEWGRSVDGRHFAVRAGFKRRPQTRFHQIIDNLLALQAGKIRFAVFGVGFRFIAVDLDYDRLENTPLAAVDFFHHARGG